MKKIKLFLAMLGISTLLCGCHTDNEIISDFYCDAVPSKPGTSEWISPDGVHYWVIRYSYAYGIAPRYDNKGNLVIEEVADE